MLRNEYNENRFRQGGMNGISGFGNQEESVPPVTSPARVYSNNNINPHVEDRDQFQRAESLARGPVIPEPAVVSNYYRENNQSESRQLQQQQPYHFTSPYGTSENTGEEDHHEPSRRQFHNQRTPLRSEEEFRSVPLDEALETRELMNEIAENNNNTHDGTGKFGYDHHLAAGGRKGRGTFRAHNDTGGDIFGRSLPNFENRDEFASAADGISNSSRRNSDAHNGIVNSEGSLNEDRITSTTAADYARAKNSAARKTVTSGLTSDQMNRSKYGRRRYAANDQVSQIF